MKLILEMNDPTSKIPPNTTRNSSIKNNKFNRKRTITNEVDDYEKDFNIDKKLILQTDYCDLKIEKPLDSIICNTLPEAQKTFLFENPDLLFKGNSNKNVNYDSKETKHGNKNDFIKNVKLDIQKTDKKAKIFLSEIKSPQKYENKKLIELISKFIIYSQTTLIQTRTKLILLN